MSTDHADGDHCEQCLTEPAFGLMTLHDHDGHHLAEWWTCCDCADRDAPIHTARGVLVSVIVPDWMIDA